MDNGQLKIDNEKLESLLNFVVNYPLSIVNLLF